MIALDASAVGKTTANVPLLAVLSAPKSKTITVGSPEAESLNIKAPRAVKLAEAHVESAKSVSAVVPEVEGLTRVRVFPLAEYALPAVLLISLPVVYAVVAAVKVALFVYRAS
tara:strand:+ start:995 stop:1333 length:339 start_codon:yes stop_codon:yes gene_type:complete